jgi:hypothetical protein
VTSDLLVIVVSHYAKQLPSERCIFVKYLLPQKVSDPIQMLLLPEKLNGKEVG